LRRFASAGAALLVLVLAAPGAADRPRVIRVPRDAPDLRIAVALAHAGDTILVDRGVYAGGVTVPPSKPRLTIRGADRNAVVLDGRDRERNGISVHADDVAILNMSAHDFLANAFYWDDVARFRAEYLTVWNVRGYGIYAEGSTGGTIAHDYVSGAADAAYYVGECRPCRSVISHVVARRSAVGYSGTNASGSLVIRDSVWDENGVGILPNSYANEKRPPQSDLTIVGNIVRRSGRAAVPLNTPLAGFVGIGIAVAGGNDDVVRGNRVSGSERYGIVVFPTVHHITFRPAGDRLRPYWRPRGNRVVANHVIGSGLADLALALGSGSDNCFAANAAATTLPRSLDGVRCPAAVDARGDPDVAAALTAPIARMVDEAVRSRRPPPFTAGARPAPQPSLPR
jgi:hypothetical protein